MPLTCAKLFPANAVQYIFRSLHLISIFNVLPNAQVAFAQWHSIHNTVSHNLAKTLACTAPEPLLRLVTMCKVHSQVLSGWWPKIMEASKLVDIVKPVLWQVYFKLGSSGLYLKRSTCLNWAAEQINLAKWKQFSLDKWIWTQKSNSPWFTYIHSQHIKGKEWTKSFLTTK